MFVERSRYYLVAKKKTLNQRYLVRVNVSPMGRLVMFHQFQRLPRQDEDGSK